MTPRKGTPVLAAWWYDADAENALPKARMRVARGLIDFEQGNRVILKRPFEWETVDPLSPRVCDPPPGMIGNIKCLIGESVIVDCRENVAEKRLATELTEDRLKEMRDATRRAWALAGGKGILSDGECDSWINREGPTAAVPETIQ